MYFFIGYFYSLIFVCRYAGDKWYKLCLSHNLRLFPNFFEKKKKYCFQSDYASSSTFYQNTDYSSYYTSPRRLLDLPSSSNLGIGHMSSSSTSSLVGNNASTNLIVNYLPQDMNDRELYSLFRSCGPIESCRIMRDFKVEKNEKFSNNENRKNFFFCIFFSHRLTIALAMDLLIMSAKKVLPKRLKLSTVFRYAPKDSKYIFLFSITKPKKKPNNLFFSRCKKPLITMLTINPNQNIFFFFFFTLSKFGKCVQSFR